TEPIAGGIDAPHDATITVNFDEPVNVEGSWFDITCANSGRHNSATIASYDGSKGFHITPNTGFEFGEQCTVTIFHGNVHDQDANDTAPNTADTLLADYSWTFTVVAAGAPAPHPPSVHLSVGNPSNAVANLEQGDNYLMEKPSFALSYNKDKGTPNWVSWHLEDTWTGNLPRTDTFRADPAVSPDWYRVQATDYAASGFNRVQLTPNDDRNNPASIPLNQETFLMSNVVPMAPDNQGPWAGFENYLRTFLPANEIYIVAGPTGVGGSGDNGPANTIANGHVTVPAFTWKVALVLPAGENDLSRVNAATRTIAVIIPNVTGADPDWHSYLTTVDQVEALTGYDFFANVSDNFENLIEAGIDGANPPGTENQSATTEEDVPVEIILNALSRFPNPTLTFTIMSQPAHGVLSGSGPNFTYTPAPNFHGSDSFTFKVNDGGAQDSNTSTVDITVTEVNDTPSANSQSVTTNSNTPVAITLTGNDLETAFENLLFEVTVSPAHGSLSGSGANFTYTPNANYSGPDSFQFTVRDTGDGASPASTSAAATVSITVTDTIAPSVSAPANVTVTTSPNATTCGTVVTDAQLGVANASDNSGSVSVERSGVPGGNVFPVGTTTITYTATDAAGNSTAASQTVTVIDNTAPTLTAPSPTSVTADSTGHATIPDVVALTAAGDNCGPVTLTQSPLAGTVVGIGTHTITITATDAAGNTSTATTTFTANAVNVGSGLRFSLSVSPTMIERNKTAKIDIAYANTSAERLSVTFVVRYANARGSFLLDTIGPNVINPGTEKNANLSFHVPKTACTGQYTFTVEAYVGGVFVGTDTADLTVTTLLANSRAH
ncbi:MAG TPA: DNA/RNA non-specific endonuclease, partial [Pyrinomonadaceae bacterium]|nr:DNA/RNA non-specific endonuclease [Pyrinomonadaceae bacterium]